MSRWLPVSRLDGTLRVPFASTQPEFVPSPIGKASGEMIDASSVIACDDK
jgi:hypothetical protein